MPGGFCGLYKNTRGAREHDMQRKIRALRADIEEAEAAEDLWPCPPNEKRIERFRELLEYYEADLEAMREARKRKS